MSELTVAELRNRCREKGLKGYSKLNRAQLLELLGQVPQVQTDLPQDEVSVRNLYSSVSKGEARKLRKSYRKLGQNKFAALAAA